MTAKTIRHTNACPPGDTSMFLADTFDGVDDDYMLFEYQAWFDQHAPGAFEVIAVDCPAPGPSIQYYLVPNSGNSGRCAADEAGLRR